MRLIDADKLSLHLADWAMAEAPDERTPNKVKEYTAKDMQQMIYRTINEAIQAVDRAPTIRVRGEKKKKEPYIPPCIEPPKESDLPTCKELKSVSLEAGRVVPVFEFTPIRPRKKIEIPEPMKETIIRFDSMQEAYDKLVAAEPEVYPDVQKAEEVNEWELAMAGYRLGIIRARKTIEAEFKDSEDPGFKRIAPGLLTARAKLKEMEKL